MTSLKPSLLRSIIYQMEHSRPHLGKSRRDAIIQLCVDKLEDNSQWVDIKTVPPPPYKNILVNLVLHDGRRAVHEAWYSEDKGWHLSPIFGMPENITHWREMPAEVEEG